MASLEEEGVQVLTYWYVYDEPLEMILHCNQKKTIYRFNVVTVTVLIMKYQFQHSNYTVK
jgi:hypothetical protein